MRRILFCISLLFVSLFQQNKLYAEGRGSAAGNPLFGSAAQEGVLALYAYAQAGEKIDWRIERTRSAGSTKDGRWNIYVYSPVGLVATGMINSSTIGTNYTTAKISVTAATAGIWTLLAIPTSNGNNDAVSFDLTVYTTGNVAMTGRVFTYSVHGLDQSSPLEPTFTLYFLNPDGYQYSGIYRGLNGLNYTIVSDNFGVRTSGTSCVSAYRSVSYNGKWSNMGPDSAVCGIRNKIFFNAFHAALPASSVRFNTTTGSGQIVEPLVFTPPTPTLSTASFVRTGSCIQQGNVYFSTTNFSGSVYVYYDVNGNGTFNDAIDRSDTVLTIGTNSVYFNGLDRLGNPIPISQSINVKVSIEKVGETHFVMSDIEVFGGIEVTRLNGPGSPDKTIYWDDTNLGASLNCSLTPIVDGRGGINSAGGVHGWNQCGNAVPPSSGGTTNNTLPEYGAWGNQRLIDNWTQLVPIGLAYTTNVPAVVRPDFGDLPTGWPIAVASTKGKDTNGDCIIDNNDIANNTSVWAGTAEDFESNPKNAAANATSDNYDDGMSFPPGTVSRGATYSYIPHINSNASAKRIYYGLWFDWNNNGDFTDDKDCLGAPAFYNGSGLTPLAGGITSLPISVCVPTDAVMAGGVSVNNYKVRLIVSDSAIIYSRFNSSFGNGEVEDYQLPLVLLPISFGAISATENDCNVLINFETLQELNTDHFTIERSSNGFDWDGIAFIQSQHKGNTVTKYQYTDTRSSTGQNYYRIVHIDRAGKSQYSKTLSVLKNCNSQRGNISIYPNPVKNILAVASTYTLQNTEIKIINTMGQTLITIAGNVNAQRQINTEKLAKGCYILQLIKKGEIIYQDKFIKL
ncbi:T9SS type A sorting domain-containing protein [Ferruginibacter sp. SUN002]|uniref:T9SS type A sorting domain-containing protein n=1 Tax=Ferruginibacter sp. SUN002 TaxID=2937789 RepID=UPI003D36F5EE